MLSVESFEGWISYFRLSIFAWRSLVRFGGTADAFIRTTSLGNSRMICSTSGVLDSWDSSFVRFLDNSASMFALSFNRNSSSCHCRSRPISGPVADRPARDSSSISLDTAAFREPILSSADVVQRVVENCCLVHENWVLYVNHVLVRLSSILLLSLPLPKFSRWFSRAWFASWEKSR